MLGSEVTYEFGQFVEKQWNGLLGAHECHCLFLDYEV